MNRSIANPVLLSVVFCVVLLSAPRQLFAHGDIHERILALNLKIASATNDAALYVQRGELQREHQDWKAAVADFDRARELDGKLVRLDFFRARLANDMGELVKARGCLDKLLLTITNDTEALVLCARVRVKLNDATGAVADFNRAIECSREPQPELFLERAELLVAQGQVDEALHGLDEGVKRLGNLIVLQARALDVELSRTNYDGALLRVQAIVEASPRQESWLARQGDMLKQAGRTAEAKVAWTNAVKAIDALPNGVRESEAMMKLRYRLRAELEQPKQ